MPTASQASRDFPVSASHLHAGVLALGTLGYCSTVFCMGSEHDQDGGGQVIMLAWRTLYPLSYLPRAKEVVLIL